MSFPLPNDYQKAVEFHGHSCPGLTIGYLAAKAALEHLGVARAEDEELVAIVESDGCGIDAVQVLLGCTIGKGNLIYKDYGKQAYTIGSRRTGAAVRVVLSGEISSQSPEQQALRAKVFGGRATADETAAWRKIQQSRIEQLFGTPVQQLFKIQDVKLTLPPQAKIFNSVQCEYCGEKVMEARARIKDGKIACLACTEEYTRGW